MDEARLQILQMVADGTISAEEADDLLAAMGPEEKVIKVAGDPVIAAATPGNEGAGRPPDFERFRNRWRLPLFIAGGSLLISFLGLMLMYQSTADIGFIGFLCIWSIFLLAALVTAIVMLGRRSTWLYVRIEEKAGRRIAFGLPVPIRFVGLVLNLIRRFVPEGKAGHIESAAAIVSAVDQEISGDPFVFEVDDDDGDKVQVYLG